MGVKINLERYEVVMAVNTAVERYVSTMKNQLLRQKPSHLSNMYLQLFGNLRSKIVANNYSRKEDHQPFGEIPLHNQR